MDLFKWFMRDVIRPSPSFTWLRATEANKKHGMWHIHLVLHCDHDFDVYEFREWRWLTDIRLARGFGPDPDGHIKKSHSHLWHHQRRLDQDVVTSANPTEPRTGSGTAGIARYLTPYIASSDKAKNALKGYRQYGTSHNYGSPERLLRLLGITCPDPVLEFDNRCEFRRPYWRKYGRTWLDWKTVTHLLIEHGLEIRPKTIVNFRKLSWLTPAYKFVNQILSNHPDDRQWHTLDLVIPLEHRKWYRVQEYRPDYLSPRWRDDTDRPLKLSEIYPPLLAAILSDTTRKKSSTQKTNSNPHVSGPNPVNVLYSRSLLRAYDTRQPMLPTLEIAPP